MGRELVTYHCGDCNKRFNNQVEIDPPFRNPITLAIRYYFQEGTVLYRAYGPSVAYCWDCLENA